MCDTLSLAEEKNEMMIAIGANCLAPPIVPLICGYVTRAEALRWNCFHARSPSG